jgi:diphthine-ammonia ligase
MSGKTIASWSGGKDSCLACYRELQAGRNIDVLMNMTSLDTGRCCFHGVEDELMTLQAESIGIPMVRHAVPDDMKEYEAEFKKAVLAIGEVETMVFGDIYLDAHKDWVERVCSDVGVEALEPLWNEDTEKLAHEFIDAGFKTIIVSCHAEKMGKEFAGRLFDRDVVEELKKIGVCPCGENGEFHTLVVDGPIFSNAIDLCETEVIYKKGFWDHWFLDIKQYKKGEVK